MGEVNAAKENRLMNDINDEGMPSWYNKESCETIIGHSNTMNIHRLSKDSYKADSDPRKEWDIVH